MTKIIPIEQLRPMTMAAVLLLLTFQFGIASGQTKASVTGSPKASPSPTASPSTPDAPAANPAIPMLDVVARADELTARLQAMITRVNADQRLASVDAQLKASAPAIAQKQRELEELIAISPTRFELGEIEQEWLAEQVRYRELKDTLAEHGIALESDLAFLDGQEGQWAATENTIPRNDVTTSIHERIATARIEISGAQKVLRVAQASLLALQAEISQQNKVVTETLAKITQLRVRAQRSLLERDSPPLWRLFSEADSTRPVGELLAGSYQRNALRTRAFLRSQSSLLWLSLAIFLVTLAGALAVRKSGSRILKFEPSLRDSLSLFDNPVSLAVLTALTLVLLVAPSVPQLVRGAGILLCLYPVYTLYVRRIAASFRPIVLSLMAFGLLRSVFEILNLSSTLRRVILMIWQVSFAVFMAWLVQKAYRKTEVLDRKTRFVLAITWVLLVFLTVAILANIFGYVSLSLVLSAGSVISSFGAIVLRTEFMILSSLVTMLVMFGRGSSLSILNTYGNDVVSWGRRLAAVMLMYLWAYVSLTAFGVRRAVLDAASRLFYTPFRLGAAGITLWDIAVFVIVLVIGVLVAGITRVVLRDDILGRLNLKHGIPYAISTLSYYVMLLLVFVLALASAGVELSKFTLLTGAFGVGVGFGLQNTINNFASGLILLFERPIRVGDFLEVGNVIGEVERIGMRSSSMRTVEGAEVIVPNSNLVTSQVTNWTLSKPRRRVVIRMMTRWDANPEMVLALMHKVAEDLPGIMTAPKPDALFLGIERGFPRFELRFWVNQVRRHQKARSEAAIKLNAAFTEAGINLDVRQLFLKKDLEGLTDEGPMLND